MGYNIYGEMSIRGALVYWLDAYELPYSFGDAIASLHCCSADVDQDLHPYIYAINLLSYYWHCEKWGHTMGQFLASHRTWILFN